MKAFKPFITAALIVSFCAAPLAGFAADKKSEKPKPYPLKTCVVTDEKLGDMGDAYVFVHEGREIKLCCKSCLKDFKKDPAKYLKKIDEAEAKAKKK
jgi:hypothetical protein